MLESAATVAREHADEAEALRRLPAVVVDALRDAELLRMAVPATLGGPEVAPGESLRRAEAVARADASAGWCVSIHVTSSVLAAYLPPDGAAEVLGDARSIASGVWAPVGTAAAVDGGVRVSGRWAFCSGIDHADHLFAGCVADDGALKVVAIPRGELELLDTWHTSGLRGTGSRDAVAHDVFVPARRVLSIADGPLVDAPLYRFPVFGFFAASIAAAALGNARGALDDFATLATAKVGLGSRRTLAERPAVQAALAEAEATLRAARGLYYEGIEACWSAAQTGPVPVDARRDLRLGATFATRSAAAAVRTVHDLAGGTAVYDTSPLSRRFRDAHTATAHFQVNLATYELLGRLLLGVDADVGLL
ncbi:MAG: indole-3-acetate monooxygenase [Solirubrobacteraceae bacterium]|jgi:alkylation response protein AidB-like acyl-CoA dehydrogenase|nr:indole-3-acetate monooxygenase [Solirubrobacteraceae bacterium]